MGAAEWIALAGLVGFWLITIITFWINIKIKITELDLKITNTNQKLNEHINWGESEQIKNLKKFDHYDEEMKNNYKVLADKMDKMIENFGEFRVYCEKNFKR